MCWCADVLMFKNLEKEMPLGLLGRKKGMTQIFDTEGEAIPVTVIETGPCTVVQKKTVSTDGYNAIQLGFAPVAKKGRLTKPYRGHFEKKKLDYFAKLREFRIGDPELFSVGDCLPVGLFQVGDLVDIRGWTKGRGFQGVIKRHGKHGGPDAHGSDFHRRPGSIGMRTQPGRVFKNTRLPGRLGNEQVMLRNLKVREVRGAENLLLVEGGIPGHREGLVIIYNRNKDFEARWKKKEC